MWNFSVDRTRKREFETLLYTTKILILIKPGSMHKNR